MPAARAAGPPKPPPRRPPAPPAGAGLPLPPQAEVALAAPVEQPAQPPSNPFMAAEPSPAPAPLANPFLAGDPTAQPQVTPTPVTPQAATPQAAAPTAVPSPSGPAGERVAPLVGIPGAVAPTIKDPHAEFRRGSWKKPVIVGGLAALALSGMFYLLPSEVEEKPSASFQAEAEAEPPAVIGRSVAPGVIEDPNNPVLRAAADPQKDDPSPASTETEPAPSPDRPDRSGNFADSFKSAAK